MILPALGPWLQLLLVLARILSFVTTAPIFNRPQIPPLHKIGISMVLSLVVVFGQPEATSWVIGPFLIALIVETLTGLAAGLTANWLFVSMQMGGAIMDQQAGFGTASVFDPASFGQVSLLANLFLVFSILLFLELNGLHLIIMAVMRTFTFVPAGSAVLNPEWSGVILAVLGGAFSLMIRLAAPVVAAMVVTDLTLGKLGRVVPQLNVLMLALPVKAGVALLVIAATVPLTLGVGEAMITHLETLLVNTWEVISP